MMNKKAFEFSFSWIFAIIVGAVVMFLAIYAASQFVKTQRTVQDTELGKEIGIILNPIETSLEEAKLSQISLQQETRIFNDCISSGSFGSQKISTATKLGIGKDWQNPGVPSSFHNKYLFSSSITEGKSFNVFSKPFEMPYKIANLIYLWPSDDSYCFINPPREIESELSNLNIENLEIKSKASECFSQSKKVCFTSSGCDIDISLDLAGDIRGSLKKSDFSQERVYFENSALLYGAIFTDSNIYECQVKRLMSRASELSWLYYSKSSYLAQKGCNSNLELDLAAYANKTFSIKSSLELRDVSKKSEELRRRNNDLLCELF